MIVNNSKPDTKQYLRDLIDHYEQLLSNGSSSLVEVFNDFIHEEKLKCLHKYNTIKRVDAEAMIMGNVFASPFPTTN